MKFFTMAWWMGDQPSATDPRTEYLRYLAIIREQLPSDLITLQEHITLHDARVREIWLDVRESNLYITLEKRDGQVRQRSVQLTYFGVTSFRSQANPQVGLPGPYGYGEWGYDEVDVTSNGRLEHRVLFSSGIMLEIHFSDFKLVQHTQK